jgi:hypothetical protein
MKTTIRKQKAPACSLANITAATVGPYARGIQSGLRWQEQVGQCWSWMLHQASRDGWRPTLNTVTVCADDVLALGRERLEEMLAVMEHGNSTGAELVLQAITAVQAPGIAQRQDRWREFWTSSLTTVRNHAAALAKISSRTVESWVGFLEKHTVAGLADP